MNKQQIKTLEDAIQYLQEQHDDHKEQYSDEKCDSTDFEEYGLNEFCGGKYQAFEEAIEVLKLINKEPEREAHKEQMYYIQDSRSYVGNCMSFWAEGNGGYVCQLSKAGLYTYEEAMDKFKSRETDIPWKQQDIEAGARTFVDIQLIKYNETDPFYQEVEAIKDKNREEARLREIEANKEALKQELEWILEAIELRPIYNSEVKKWQDFETKFEDAKRDNEYFEYFEHYYPITYNMSNHDIFEELLKHKMIFQCPDCKSYFEESSRFEEENYKHLCDHCGEEQYYKDNPDG